jgi:RNA polymerase sigma factor (sigma-70 family)
MTHRSDVMDDLAHRLAADLDGAFPDLVRALQDPVFSGVLRLTRDRADAEEITQEAFVRAYGALERYPAEQVRGLALRPWLWTIALNLCRNRARSRRRRPAEVALGDHDGRATGSTEDEAIAAADHAWRRRLETLAEPVRAAVVLRHVVGLGYDEIAAALDRPTGTVKSDVHRGIERLRTLLIEEGARP